jgi:hypothetical protein
MDIEVLVICDSAQIYQDKLVVVGTFNTIYAEHCPFVYPAFSLACRLNYTDSNESGTKDVKIAIIDEKGQSIMPVMDFSVAIPYDIRESYISNIVAGFANIKFDNFGRYSIRISIGDFHKDLYLYLKKGLDRE